jgi:hypothetical protein
MAVMVGTTRDLGDSSGPVYFAATAHGIHHGREELDGEYRDYFMKASSVFDAIQIYIVTN